MKKKILVLANSSKGVYSFRNELMLEILKKYELYISMPDEVCKMELENEGCIILNTPIDRRGMSPKKDFELFKNYKKILKEVKPDLVLSYTIKPNVYGGLACRVLKIPYIETVTGLGNAFQTTGLVKKIIVSLYKLGTKKAECLFFQNADNMKVFEECNIHGKKSKLVMGSGVNLEIHPYEEYPKNEKIKILFMSRILKEKGIEEFLGAAKALKQDNVEFCILGRCEEDYEEIISQYAKEGYITNYGFDKNVNPYLKECSALVLPSFYPEGISNVLMEASATGRPVLTTNRPGCKDVVDENISGFLFEPQNVESLEEAINKFLKLSQEEKEEMGKKARLKMEREFDRKKVISDYITVIEGLLEEK